MKQIVILGATGSIGTNTLDIINRFPDRFQILGLTAKSSDDKLEAIVRRLKPRVVALADPKSAAALARRIRTLNTEVLVGEEGIKQVACLSEADLVISAIVGAAGLIPTLSAIKTGTTVALANKEPMVMAGEIIQGEAKKRGLTILPIDSEHSAIFQVLNGERHIDIKRIVLTASGGPLLKLSKEMQQKVTKEEALNHPNWKMGPKISIDSATLMNKGLEIIEAKWLFDLPPEKIDVVIHPQSIIHSMVEFVDRSVVAQMGLPDMIVPISYVLNYPERTALDLPSLDLAAIGTLNFAAPDFTRFPLLSLAYEVLKAGGTLPSVLNAANEVAVAAFLNERIAFGEIENVIRKTVDAHLPQKAQSIDDVMAADAWARSAGEQTIAQIGSC